MKRLMVVLVVVLAAYAANAQQPVKWHASAKPLKKNVFEIKLTATISEGWYIYSQFMGENGPMPTRIAYDNNSVDTLGQAVETGKLQQKYDSVFGTEIQFYYNKVEFTQQVRGRQKLPLTLTGSVTYMGCNAEMCMPPQEEKFNVILK